MRFFLIILFLIGSYSFGQLSTKNKALLRTTLVSKINDLRADQGLRPLMTSDTLQHAANLHSVYMAKHALLSHEEKSSRYKTPQKRVRASKGRDFNLVGENILLSKPQPNRLNKSAILTLADEMFVAWKNSPGHYANMVHSEYEFGDLGFAMDTKTRIVYATHVFGQRGYKVPNQLSRNAFGLRMAPDGCPDQFAGFLNILATMGNAVHIKNDSVFLYYHDIQYFKRIITSSGDGLAVDLITRDQLNCSMANQLDNSPIYDGTLLAPVYRTELFASNQAKGDYRIICNLGAAPPHLKGKQLKPSLVLIKNRKKCSYLVPACVQKAPYPLTEIKPKRSLPSKLPLSYRGVTKVEKVTYDFSTSSTSPLQLPPIPSSNYPIHSVYIQSFSSIEGDSINNVKLYNSRAEQIKQHLRSKYPKLKDHQIRLETKENWELMMFQLHYFEREDLTELPYDSLRQLAVSGDTSLSWDALLFNQRKASALIFYKGQLPSHASPSQLTELSLTTGIATSNSQMVNNALYELYDDLSIDPRIILDEHVKEYALNHPEIIVNYSALLSEVIDDDPLFATAYLFHWIQNSTGLSEDALYNLSSLYTIISRTLIDDWDLSAQRLANVIHPEKTTPITASINNKELVLNLHLAFIEYYGQINDGKGIRRSFDFIADYFTQKSSSPEDDNALALFFNDWSMYPMTNDFLMERFHKNALNEDGVFILAETLNIYPGKHSASILPLHKKAISLNAKRWCEWINSDFQRLRDPAVKQLYCPTCN